MSTEKTEPSLKRPRIDDEQTPMSTVNPPDLPLALLPTQTQKGESSKNESPSVETVARTFPRLRLTINPTYIKTLTDSGILGFSRMPDQFEATPRYYEFNVGVFATAISNILTPYLTYKFERQGCLSANHIAEHVAVIVPLTSDACVAALYTKQRFLHQANQIYAKYKAMFDNPASYTEDLELPLPFADAIQNIGAFCPNNSPVHYFVAPVYPEGVQNEGRSTQDWNSCEYELVMPILRSLGIPLKSVDVLQKKGTAWWTFKVLKIEEHFDFQCIFAPSNYSDHDAMTASMFLVQDDKKEPVQLIKHQDKEQQFPVRLREIPPGFQIRTFSALCHAPPEEWTQFYSV